MKMSSDTVKSSKILKFQQFCIFKALEKTTAVKSGEKMFKNNETFFEKYVDRFRYTWYYRQADAVSGAETAREH